VGSSFDALSPLEYGLRDDLPSTDSAQLLALIVAKQVLEEPPAAVSGGERDKISVSWRGHRAGAGGPHGARLDIRSACGDARAGGVRGRDRAREGTLEKAYVPWQESTFPGMLANVVAGRVANRFDLGGPTRGGRGVRELAGGGVDRLNDSISGPRSWCSPAAWTRSTTS